MHWDGGPSGDGTNFLDPINWAGDALPLAADTAVIGATGSSPTITISGTPAVQTITSARNLRMTGGTLSGGTVAFSGGAALLASSGGGTLLNVAITGDVLLNTQDSNLVLNGTTSFTAARLSASNTNLHMRAGYTLNSLVVSEGAAGGNRAINLGFGGGGTVTFGPSAVVRLAAGSVGQMLIAQTQVTTLVNNGLISAEGTGQHFSIQPSAMTNNGILQVNAGAMTVQPSSWTNPGTVTGTAGTISLGGNLNATAGIGTFTTSSLTVNVGGTITNTGNTITLNSTTGSWNLIGGTINNGAINESGVNLVMTSAGGTLANVAVTGDLILNTTDARVVLSGTTSFTSARLSGSNSRLQLTAGYTLNSLVVSEGTGGGNRSVDLGFGGGGTITFGPSAVLRTAAGSVGQLLVSQSQVSTLINNGLISSEAAGQHVSIQPSALTNNGILQTSGTGAITVSSAWTNPGTVTGTGGTFNIGGTFNATAGIGSFNTSAVTVNVVGTITNTGNTITLNGATGSWRLAGGTINNGAINETVATLVMTSSGGTLGSVAITGDLILNTTDARVLLTGNTSFTAARLSGASTRLHMAAGYTLNSLVVSEGTAGGNRSLDLGFGGGGTITFGPSAVVRTGAGSVGQIVIGQSQVSTLINNGLISSEAAGQHILIMPSTLTNHGTLQTAGTGAMTVGSSTWTNPGSITGSGGTFNISGNFNATSGIGTFSTSAIAVNVTGTITNTGNTLTLNATTGPWRLAGGTINNGAIVEAAGTDLVTTTSGGTLNSVAITGDLRLNATDARVLITGTTTFSAARLSGSSTFLQIAPGYTLNSLVVSEGTAGGNRTLSLATGAAGTVTIGPTGVVRTAAGSVGQMIIGNNQVATLVNNGLILAEANGQNLLIQPTAVTNNGVLSASNGSRLTVSSNIGGNPGQVRADGSGSILTIQTGAYTVNQQTDATNNGLIHFAGAPTKAATFNASGRFVLDYTGAANTPFAQVKADVISGYAGGAWNGPGINSTAAAVTPRTAVGFAEASTVLSATGGLFAGANVDGTAVLIRYTLAGDANINGSVDIDDFGKLAAKFNRPGEWTDGDTNYTGVVDIDDFGLLAANFNQSLPGELPPAQASAAVRGPAALAPVFGGVRVGVADFLDSDAGEVW